MFLMPLSEQKNGAYEEMGMKRILGIALLAALCAVPAFAANSVTLHVGPGVMAGDIKLNEGDYKLSWDGTGASVTITLSLEGRKILTAPARVIEAKHEFPQITLSSKNGKDTMQTIELKNMTLVVGVPTAAGK
jgi:hypothetical protein